MCGTCSMLLIFGGGGKKTYAHGARAARNARTMRDGGEKCCWLNLFSMSMAGSKLFIVKRAAAFWDGSRLFVESDEIENAVFESRTLSIQTSSVLSLIEN